jgi:hypothetical protein
MGRSTIFYAIADSILWFESESTVAWASALSLEPVGDTDNSVGEERTLACASAVGDASSTSTCGAGARG